MGADLRLHNERVEGGEPVADIELRHGPIRGTTIEADEVPTMIDELPVLAVIATQAEGYRSTRRSRITGKETDRIATTVDELRRMGARIEALADGFLVEGPTRLHGAHVESHDDHRLAMSLAVAALAASGETTIEDTACLDDSFPGFEQALTVCSGETTSVSGTVQQTRTRTVGLIGYPVEHSLSPAMHNAAFTHLGLWYRYVLLPTPPGELERRVEEYVERRVRRVERDRTPQRGDGVAAGRDERRGEGNRRVQHCAGRGWQAAGLQYRHDRFYARTGRSGRHRAESSVVVLGAGGAARGVAWALRQAGHEVIILSRKPEQASVLAGGLGATQALWMRITLESALEGAAAARELHARRDVA